MKPETAPALARGMLAAMAAASCAHPGAGTAGASPAVSGTFHDATGERVGVATLTDSAGSLWLAVSVGSLAPGPHGLHFHAQGRCDPPDFASAGPHLNPAGRKHGRLNPDGPHLGDLPNLTVGQDGSADTSFAVPVELVGTGPGSLLQPEGTALVIHADPDDERTDPSGSSGARVACAVLERA